MTFIDLVKEFEIINTKLPNVKVQCAIHQVLVSSSLLRTQTTVLNLSAHFLDQVASSIRMF